MTRRVLKLKHDTPVWIENRLVHKYGYHIFRRSFKEPILFVKWTGLEDPNNKTTIMGTPPTSSVTTQSVNARAERAATPHLSQRGRPLSAAEEIILEQRCDNIVDFFPDPYAHVMSVRARLHNMRQTLRTVEEQQYVLDYIEENFEEGA